MGVSLDGQKAVVTGGAQGIGFAIAERLLKEGASVALWDMNAEELANAAAALSGQGTVTTHQVDIVDHAAVEQAAAATEAEGGAIAILVNSAGISGPTVPMIEYDPREWKRVVDIDLYGTFNVNQTIVRRMIDKGYGRIVNIASIAGKEGNPNASAYSAAKAGVIALTKSLGKETAHLDIAVNCITPAVAKTRILEQCTQAHIDYMLSKIPRGRLLLVEEIAAMVAWLVSRENSFTTGATFDLSGGRATY
ncbi:SDR family NAD(P)-dependent oxidoreductase [Marinivivus vitaminiproducens]|uniref:SDR family NAD(P)-dependent oxidoreductase n=1 Tax=Marinivivus vitaminiproducens TaxID=3035935 RepID=UPI00279F269C|nr:SDR family NAD(P)-dependent oxidoreductase [Geminicoccaceae bacterium SCSIO 64248]